jgi:exonuclease SbcD
VRVLHTSDWHLGRSFHGSDVLDHQRAFVQWLVDLVATQEIELVVVAGDVYDRAVPPLPAVALWEEAVIGLTRTCPLLVTSGNHDSPTRLGFAGSLLARSGLHLRTALDTIADPVLVHGRDGVELAAYGIPYLEPDLHREALGAERSHAAVLGAAMDRVRADLAERPGVRSLVAAHAFITGGGDTLVSDSERDLRVGGVGDAPWSVLKGVDVVTLGHLHGAQQLSTGTSEDVVTYSGSPLAYSFSEEKHRKSVSILQIPPDGPVMVERIEAPVPRPLVSLTGTLAELLVDPRLEASADSWVRVHLIDERRPDNSFDRLHAHLPYLVELTFEHRASSRVEALDPDGRPTSDPLAIAESFIEHVTGSAALPTDQALLREAIEHVRIAEISS